jgi:hypothetical protein
VLAAPDVMQEYEHSLNPDLGLHTDAQSEWGAAEDLLHFASRDSARSWPKNRAYVGRRCTTRGAAIPAVRTVPS